MSGRRVVRSGGGNVAHLLRPPPHGGIFPQIPGAVPFGVRRLQSGIDTELAERASEMGLSIMDDWIGGREGGGARTLGVFYAAVVQVGLIYGSGSWVMSLRIGKILGGFHHQVIWLLTGKMPQRNGNDTWTYPPVGVNDGGRNEGGGDLHFLTP